MCMTVWSEPLPSSSTFYKVVHVRNGELYSPVMEEPIKQSNFIPEGTQLELAHGGLSGGAFHLFANLPSAQHWLSRLVIDPTYRKNDIIIPVKVDCCTVLFFSEDKTQVAVSAYTIDDKVFEDALQGRGVE